MATYGESLRPDLNDTLCTAARCLDVADVIGSVTLASAAVTHSDAPGIVVLEVPLCIGHASFLRGGVRSFGLDIGSL